MHAQLFEHVLVRADAPWTEILLNGTVCVNIPSTCKELSQTATRSRPKQLLKGNRTPRGSTCSKCGIFQQQGALIYTSNNRVVLKRTPTKRTLHLQKQHMEVFVPDTMPTMVFGCSYPAHRGIRFQCYSYKMALGTLYHQIWVLGPSRTVCLCCTSPSSEANRGLCCTTCTHATASRRISCYLLLATLKPPRVFKAIT